MLSFRYALEPLLKQRRWEKDASATQEREARGVLREKARQASKAEEMHEQTRRGLLRSIQAVRGLERHRESKQREHKRERQQLEQQKQDELWLTAGAGFRGRGCTTEGRQTQRRSSWQ